MPEVPPPLIPPPARADNPQRHTRGKFGAFLLMIAPIPVTLLLMVMNNDVGSQLYGDVRFDQPGFFSAMGVALFALLSCLFGAIKLLGGFKSGGWRIFGGIVLGLLFLMFDWFAVFLAACAAASSH